jgi:hypothetical protein
VLAGFCLAGLGIFLIAAFRIFGVLRFQLIEPDLVRVTGVHPDYLARLPELPAATTAKDNPAR